MIDDILCQTTIHMHILRSSELRHGGKIHVNVTKNYAVPTFPYQIRAEDQSHTEYCVIFANLVLPITRGSAVVLRLGIYIPFFIL